MKNHLCSVFALTAIAMSPWALPLAAHAADASEKATPSSATATSDAREVYVTSNEFKNSKTGAVVTVLSVPEYADAAFYREVNELSLRHDVVITDGFRAYPEGERADFDSCNDGTRFRAGWRARFGKVSRNASRASGAAAQEDRFAQFAPDRVECVAINLPSDTSEETSAGTTVLDAVEGRLAVPGVNRILVLRASNIDDGIEKKLEAMGFTRAGTESLRVSITLPASGDTGFSSGVPFVYKVRNSPGRTMFTGPLGCFRVDEAPAFSTSTGLWGLLFKSERNRTGFKTSVVAGLLWGDNAHRSSRMEESKLLAGLWAAESSPESTRQSFGYGLLANTETRLDTAGATESTSWSLLAPFGKKHPLLYSCETDTKIGRTTRRFLVFFSVDS